MKTAILTITLMLSATQATAQAALARHLWQESRTFETYSRTAQAITGPITLSGNRRFATTGTKMMIAFGNGKVVELTAVNALFANWDHNGGEQTGEVFEMSHDPGELLNGNDLCGDLGPGEKLYLVFSEFSGVLGEANLSASVFRSTEPPSDLSSEFLCGTYNYSG